MKRIPLLLVFISLFFLTSCSPITRSSGEIVDSQGKPIDNVKVKLTGKSLKANNETEFSTKSDGRYNFGELKVSAELPTELKLTASKDGYKPVTKDLKFGEDNIDKIVLEMEIK